MWFAAHAEASPAATCRAVQDFDQTETGGDPNNLANNQLVETVSTDGVTFLPVVNPAVAGGTLDCAGTAADCVTDNEGISGNQVVDPNTGNVYIAHTTINGSGGTPGVQVSEGKITVGPAGHGDRGPRARTSTRRCARTRRCVDGSGNAEADRRRELRVDRARRGRLPLRHLHRRCLDTSGNLTAPEQIYVVHSLAPAGADPSKVKWSEPKRVSGQGTNTFPWITAGSDGRVDVAWYHTDDHERRAACSVRANLTDAEWSVQLGQSLNAHDATPTYPIANVSEHPVKYGQICTNGLGCVTGGDRSLGDFLQVAIDNSGAAVVSYVDDTSADTAAGENAGPEVISRQIGGPSLLASVGTHHRAGQRPGSGARLGHRPAPATPTTRPTPRARPRAPTSTCSARRSSTTRRPRRCTVTIKVKSLADLTVSPTLGGPDASWIVRWTQVTPGQTGNGHIYYAGMDNNGAGTRARRASSPATRVASPARATRPSTASTSPIRRPPR